MQVVIASDIFGRTPALEALASQLCGPAETPLLLDPYGGLRQDFENEAAAYAHFQRQGGLDRYMGMVQAAIRGAAGLLALIGFSVGASAIWALSGGSGLPTGSRAFCFYGSQIRHFAAVVPRIEIELFFPKAEPHFDVAALMAQISKGERVICHRTPYLHGFMNPLSVHYDGAADAKYRAILEDRIGVLRRE